MKEFDNYQPEIPEPFSLEAIKKHYGHDVKVEYFRGEYGDLRGKPMVRVSWGAVEPKLTMDIKE